MSTTAFLGVLLGVVLVALVWLLGGGRRPTDATDDETAAAEDEVREVDAFRSPEEAEEELPDWGPGAPNP